MAIPRPNPELMTIGDSLAQGCRSLSVTGPFCSQSWSARIAKQKGWTFVPPNHPRAVLFDLEREIRNLDPVNIAANQLKFEGGFVGRYLDNLHRWENEPPASEECFDNLALAGAAIGDLYARSAESSDQSIKKIVAGNPLNALKISNVSELHISVNGRYVLNPSKNAAYATYSQLDWVEKRVPKNLFVQIGHNHGLFNVGFSATISNISDPEGSITETGGPFEPYWTQWETVANRLAALPAGVQNIVVIQLPKVGAVGNLMPVGDERKKGYALAYDPTLSTHRRMPGGDLALIDTAIQEVNRKIKALLTKAAKAKGTEKRLTFVDGYELLEAVDYKNSKQTSRRIRVNSDVTVDNRYLDGGIQFGWPPIPHFGMTKGGFFSVDGMHPSGVGYAVLASNVMDVLKTNHDKSALLDKAYRDDALLSNYPPELDMVVFLLRILRQAMNVGHFDHSPVGSLSENMHFADVLRVLKTVFVR